MKAKRIIILGTNHAVQKYGSDDFGDVVRALAKHYEAQVIVEEVDWYEQTKGHEIADKNHLAWRGVCTPETNEFGPTCEPDLQIVTVQVSNFGPVSKQTNREHFMAEKILDAMGEYGSGLFICGLGHLQSMAEKLISSGFEVNAYEWQWSANEQLPGLSPSFYSH